jgi:hypothetical protein
VLSYVHTSDLPLAAAASGLAPEGLGPPFARLHPKPQGPGSAAACCTAAAACRHATMSMSTARKHLAVCMDMVCGTACSSAVCSPCRQTVWYLRGAQGSSIASSCPAAANQSCVVFTTSQLQPTRLQAHHGFLSVVYAWMTYKPCCCLGSLAASGVSGGRSSLAQPPQQLHWQCH